MSTLTWTTEKELEREIKPRISLEEQHVHFLAAMTIF